jgi:L-alanine-DL-glutamate epimerase-like enolase superfamily enzyme
MRSEIIPWSVAVARGVPSGGVRVRSRRGASVRLIAADGTEGWGESSPLPGTSPDRWPEVLGELRALRPRALGEALESMAGIARGPADAREVAGPIETALARLELRSPSARFAVETALLDLAARRCGVPLHRVLAPSGVVTAQPIAALIDAADPVEAAVQARGLVAAGYGTLKIKAGLRFDEGLRCVHAVRDAVGAEVAIRVDANGAWNARDVPARLAVLASLDVELVEEPGSAGASCSPRVALDESLARMEAGALLPVLLASGACRAIVLKPTLLGGAARCIALAAEAARHGGAIVVTHAFGGPIELAVCAELALALSALLPDARLLAHGLAPHAVVRAIGAVPPQLDGARIVPVARPGLGLGRPSLVLAAEAP